MLNLRKSLCCKWVQSILGGSGPKSAINIKFTVFFLKSIYITTWGISTQRGEKKLFSVSKVQFFTLAVPAS